MRTVAVPTAGIAARSLAATENRFKKIVGLGRYRRLLTMTVCSVVAFAVWGGHHGQKRGKESHRDHDEVVCA